jgi:hypothetical protein
VVVVVVVVAVVAVVLVMVVVATVAARGWEGGDRERERERDSRGCLPLAALTPMPHIPAGMWIFTTRHLLYQSKVPFSSLTLIFINSLSRANDIALSHTSLSRTTHYVYSFDWAEENLALMSFNYNTSLARKSTRDIYKLLIRITFTILFLKLFSTFFRKDLRTIFSIWLELTHPILLLKRFHDYNKQFHKGKILTVLF